MNVTVIQIGQDFIDIAVEGGSKYRVYNHGVVWKIEGSLLTHAPKETMGDSGKSIAVAAFRTGELKHCRCRKGACVNARRIIKDALAS